MPDQQFRSKVDLWLVAIVAASAVIALLVLAVAGVLPAWVFTSTRYTLTADRLLVKSGPFRWQVPLAEIKSITPTRNPLSSPAWSLDRLRIDYSIQRAFLAAVEARRTLLS